MSRTDDLRFMQRALELAERGAAQVAPNPMVGAVIVRDGVIVGEGWHERYGGPHAEVMALGAAGDQARGATAYVTLEPCNHYGKTPPCTHALINAGVARVVCALRDPNPRAAGGAETLRQSGIEVEFGIYEEEALLVNAPFVHHMRSLELPEAARVPFVTLKLAISIDGAIAPRAGVRMQLTGVESQREVHRLRAESDAVAVGIGTVLADNPLLTVRGDLKPRIAPRRVVFDRRAELPLSSALVATISEAPVSIITHRNALGHSERLEAAGVTVFAAESLQGGLNALQRTGVRSLLVEGGAKLGSALLTGGLVHQLIIFQAPVILGQGALAAFSGFAAGSADVHPQLKVLERHSLGDDLMTRYAIRYTTPHAL